MGCKFWKLSVQKAEHNNVLLNLHKEIFLAINCQRITDAFFFFFFKDDTATRQVDCQWLSYKDWEYVVIEGIRGF